MNLEHIAINVPNVLEQVQWWREHLGLRIVAAGDVAPYMNFVTDDNGSMVELYSQEDVAPLDYAGINPFNLHFAFSVDDMEGERERLIRAGATPEGEINNTPAGDKLCFLRDPWQVTVQLVQRKTPMI
jgi:glyoxylase I family protein